MTPSPPARPERVVEEPLSGGFVNAVYRVGSTVRRSTGPWTSAVHALLRHLEEAGFREAPRVLGIDDHDREILTFIEGETVGWFDWPPFMRGDDGLVQLGRLLRRYHDAVRGFRPPPGTVWRNPLAATSGEIIRHGDFSPNNVICRDGRVVGVIDWDFAHPGQAIADLAYLAWYTVPLTDDRRVGQYGFTHGIDRRHRLGVVCAAYGGLDPADVVDAAIDIIDVEREQTVELAARGLEPWKSFADNGNVEAFAREAEWIRLHRVELG